MYALFKNCNARYIRLDNFKIQSRDVNTHEMFFCRNLKAIKLKNLEDSVLLRELFIYHKEDILEVGDGMDDYC